MNNALISQPIGGPIPCTAAEFWTRLRGVIYYLELEGRRSRTIGRLEARGRCGRAGSAARIGLRTNGR
jgi:hypothetical protein